MKKLLFVCCTLFLFAQCSPEKEDPFLIQKDKVGKLMKTHKVSDLEALFQADSLIRDTTRLNMGGNRKIEVFEKGGAHLLTLTPSQDTTRTIESVWIRDPRYKTPEGIGLEATYGEIQKTYEIRKVVSSLNNVLVLLKDHPMYFTISREELPGALKYSGTPVEALQIPDEARVKYLMVGWE
ncbi:hypothetical protein [Robiginitalea sp.]|jgi:hypothetical protein|uniref:hypothetical protein n=1 Tax=Robiginitalea sp. TaxID=1902411 RepID=UPI003C742419